MSLLDLLSGLSTAVGKGYEGYGVDQQLKVRDMLAQAKAAREAERDRVLDRVALAGIDPNAQRVLAAAKAGGEIEGGTPGLVNREAQLGPVKTANKVAEINQTAQPLANAKAAEITTTAAPAAEANVLKILTGAKPTADAKALEVLTTEKPEAHAAGLKAAAVGANTPEAHTPVITTNTLPNGTKEQHISAFGSKSGTVHDTGAQAKEGSLGMGARGFGQGGIIGAGSAIGSFNEMQKAHPNMQKFEQGFLEAASPSDLQAIDRFRTKLSNELQAHGMFGTVNAAIATEAERELAASNPHLALYGRNLKQWIVADLNLTRSATDRRGALDMEVSGLSIPLSSLDSESRKAYINQIWEGREARLQGIEPGITAAKAMLERLGGKHGTPTPGAVPDAGGILKKYNIGSGPE